MSIVDPARAREVAAYSTGLMLVGNTVRASQIIAEQNHATVVNTATDTVRREFTGTEFGNNMLARQAATRRLFQVNTQPGARRRPGR